MEPKYIKVSQYAKIYNLNYKTALRQFHTGRIDGYQDKITETIYIKNPDYKEEEKRPGDRVALYARVSSSSNKGSLDGQLERMELYSLAKGYRIISKNREIGSGLNEDRKVLWKLLSNTEDYDILVVEHKDRLTRFGYKYIKKLLEVQGVQLVIINEEEKKNKDEELMQDFISIVTSFCQRIYGSKRKRKTIKIIEELEKDD